MRKVVSEEALRDAIRKMNEWHPKTIILLVASAQKPGPEGKVKGNVQSFRNVYNRLFNLRKIGIDDSENKFYLHCCLGEETEYPHCERRPTSVYGKAEQRTMKDTIANDYYLMDIDEQSTYRIVEDFRPEVYDYLNIDEKLDLKPLVLFHYWKDIKGDDNKIRDLWERFSEEFGTNKPPFDEVLTCSGLDEEIPTQDFDGSPFSMKQICLPQEFGSGQIDSHFWKRFRDHFDDCLDNLKWQGNRSKLASEITSGLMYDQSIFLLGDTGTGKTTLVKKAILPALRSAHGEKNDFRFSEFMITQETTQSDLFGFQGLDGSWIEGPLTEELLIPYEEAEDDPGGVEAAREVPVLVFFDEANRVDTEGLLAPIQSAFDNLRKREDSGTITLGRDEYLLPKRIWRVFAGNSPATDIGRVNQSRPFKRRLSVVIPPDYANQILEHVSQFRSTALDLLEKASELDDPEVNEPALSLYGEWKNNSDRLEDLRQVLVEIQELPKVSVTIGLIENLLLRAASHKSMGKELPADLALCQTFSGVLAGEYDMIENVMEKSNERNFPNFEKSIANSIIGGRSSEMTFDLEAIL